MIFNIIFTLAFLIVGVTLAILTNSEERLKKAREKAIAEELEIEIEDFAVFKLVEKDQFMGGTALFSRNRKKKMLDYYSGLNSVWFIGTKDFDYEVVFKNGTERVVYVRKIERADDVD